ncbi:MAG: EexN family lipoprotein [Polaromonas sp.]
MKSILIFVASALVLAACSKVEPADTVESLLANPKHHAELRMQCKADHDKVGNALCQFVSEATRRRFMGEGKSPYADDPVPKAPPPATAPKD